MRSAEGFTDQPKVINGASELLAEVLGEKGKHARLAIGSVELPLGVAVEDDGSQPALGTLPTVPETSAPDLGKPAGPTGRPSTNPLFIEAADGIPGAISTTRPPITAAMRSWRVRCLVVFGPS